MTKSKNTASFERALFLSWYCSKGDCKFCYMSTQKPLIKDPKKARRSFESIFAEAIISEACGWEIEFLSGGYDSFKPDELVFIAKIISEITKKKQWLNIGSLSYEELKAFLPYIEGYVGTLECANPKLRKEICPSKPITKIEETFAYCDKLGLKKAITLIIGLGETLDDFRYLKDFITKHSVSKVTFYSLNPQKGTIFTRSPSIDYYEKWIKMTRDSFADISIVAGAWYDKIGYFSRLLSAGADNFTKFPALKYFRTEYAKKIEQEIKKSGKAFTGTFTDYPSDFDFASKIDGLDIDDAMKKAVHKKLDQYLKKMKKNHENR